MRAVIQGGRDGVKVLWEREVRTKRDARVAAREAASRMGPVALTLEGLDHAPGWERVFDSTNAENLNASCWREIERRVLAVLSQERTS